jgi:dTDP-4-dehydrorhamnose reductase
MKILLVSGSGFLGSHLARHFGTLCVSTSRATLDLSRPVSAPLRKLLVEGFTHVILCAANADVEACFRDPAGSRRVNVEAVREMMPVFADSGIKVAFFSSDMVFDCSRDFRAEEEPVSPTTEYGRQKAEAESLVNGLVFRTSKMMSMNLHPRSILTPLVLAAREGIPYRAFRDQFITPVFAEDVCRAVKSAFRAGAQGTFHLAGEERFSRAEMAREVCAQLGTNAAVITEISVRDAPVSEPRGPFHTLSAAKAQREFGFRPTPLSLGLKKLLL